MVWAASCVTLPTVGASHGIRVGVILTAVLLRIRIESLRWRSREWLRVPFGFGGAVT